MYSATDRFKSIKEELACEDSVAATILLAESVFYSVNSLAGAFEDGLNVKADVNVESLPERADTPLVATAVNKATKKMPAKLPSRNSVKKKRPIKE